MIVLLYHTIQKNAIVSNNCPFSPNKYGPPTFTNKTTIGPATLYTM